MNYKIILLGTFMSMLALACDEKKPITQALCERQTNRADCEAAGCTYTCGMVLMEYPMNEPWKCAKRRRVGHCLAVVKLIEDADNNNNYEYAVPPNEKGWLSGKVADIYSETTYTGFREFFLVDNLHDYPVEVLGYRNEHARTTDPCLADDPDESLFPWEGFCETDWWSDTMWDDVLPQ